MLRLDARETIAACVAAHPATRPVFVRYGLVDCCSGRATLAEAAALAQVPLGAFLGLLERAAVAAARVARQAAAPAAVSCAELPLLSEWEPAPRSVRAIESESPFDRACARLGIDRKAGLARLRARR